MLPIFDIHSSKLSIEDSFLIRVSRKASGLELSLCGGMHGRTDSLANVDFVKSLHGRLGCAEVHHLHRLMINSYLVVKDSLVSSHLAGVLMAEVKMVPCQLGLLFVDRS